MVREVCADQIKEVVRDLFLKANYEIGDDISRTVEQALKNEESPIGCQVLRDIANNNRIAAARIPEWPLFSRRSARMCTSPAVIMRKPSTKA